MGLDDAGKGVSPRSPSDVPNGGWLWADERGSPPALRGRRRTVEGVCSNGKGVERRPPGEGIGDGHGRGSEGRSHAGIRKKAVGRRPSLSEGSREAAPVGRRNGPVLGTPKGTPRRTFRSSGSVHWLPYIRRFGAAALGAPSYPRPTSLSHSISVTRSSPRLRWRRKVLKGTPSCSAACSCVGAGWR